MNQLLYIYIEDFLDFSPIEINFSNSHEINYDKDEIVHVFPKKDIVGSLYGGNITDINIIAGQNGIGKTTLLKAIAEIVKEKDRYNDSYHYRFIQVVQTGDKSIKVYSSLNRGNYTVVNAPGLSYDIEDDPTYEPGRSIVYYSPFLDFNVLELSSEIESQPIIDLSYTQILTDDLDESKDEYGTDEPVLPPSLLTHKLKNAKRQLAFVKEHHQDFSLPFDIPGKFWVNFHRLHPDKDDLSQSDYKLFDKFQSDCAEFFRGFPENKMPRETMARLMFLRNLLSLYFISINNIKTSAILGHTFTEFNPPQVDNFTNDDPEKLISLILSFFEQQELFTKTIFVMLIDIAFKSIHPDNVIFGNTNNLLSLELDLSDPLIVSVFSLLGDFQQDSNNKYIIPYLSAFISFDWSNVSSGQKMFLDLFSRLYDIKSKLLPVSDPILMIIDEGEMGFHPEWQIKYIETLKTFFNVLFEDNDFQILLATHSPLVLSDFPKDRVHLLKRNGQTGIREKIPSMGTFAQNTSELLANDFFIETSLIGSLAKTYINQILLEINELIPGKVKPVKATGIAEKINLIDEPVIRQLLFNELERKANA
jgi:energy-coupling factor transporter ATP-binding protein EcfA2